MTHMTRKIFIKAIPVLVALVTATGSFAASLSYQPNSSVASGTTTKPASSLPVFSNQSAAPQQYQTAPQQYQTAPQQYQTAPQQYQTTPQQYQTTPQQYQTTPQQYQTTPQQYQTTPQQYQTTPQQQIKREAMPVSALTGLQDPNPALPVEPPPPLALQTPSKAPEPEETSSVEKALTTYLNGAEKVVPSELKPLGLKQFGYNYFRTDSKVFEEFNDIPVGPEYLLGAGDRLLLTLWGSIEGAYPLEVNRSGEVVLPKVGPLKVSGVSYGQLPDLISAHLRKIIKNFQLSVTMDKLRMVKVYVVGEVKAPGDYSLSSLSTMINALSAAGGPTKNGSLRSIDIRRNGKLVASIDLYDFFLKGDKSQDVRLQAGDTVFVPSIGPVAAISGNVRRPAIYELKGEKNLKELIRLAGGVISSGFLQRVQIARTQAHDKNIVADFNLDTNASGAYQEELAAQVALNDMDLVKIFPIDATLRGYVRLEGHVLRPGDYAFKTGMRLDSLLSPDNLLPEYNATSGQLIRRFPPDYQPQALYFNLGRVLAKEPQDNIELQELDTIRVFSRWELEEMPTVRISGEVQKPGPYRYYNNMKVRDLLLFGGNPKLTAYLKDAEITRINKTGSTVTSFPILISLEEALKGDPQHNIALEPHDELVVRRIPNWSDENDRYITLKGEFLFPGVYPIYRGERISSVIKRAGGFTSKAYLKGSKLTRSSVREMQQKRMEEFVASAERELNTKMAESASTASTAEELAANKAALEGIRNNLQALKNAKAEGRVVFRLDQPEGFAGSSYDIEAMGGDTIEVPQDSKSVSVLGRVVNPTSFIHQPGNNVGDYLDLAGGLTRESDDEEVYVIRADGSIFSRQQHSALSSLFGGSFFGQPIASGDTIIVPQKYEKTAWLRTIKDITTIMSQIAITAGTVLLGLK